MSSNEALAAHIMRIINKLIFLEKKSIFEFQGLRLYPSEIHLMGVITADQAINATAMARALGVTKGAVSQTLTRLEKKGILYKTKDPYNKNELTAHFTKLGEAAMESHQKMRSGLQKEYEQYLAALPEGEKEVIKQFLSHVEQFVDRLS